MHESCKSTGVRPAVSYPELVGGVLKQLRGMQQLDQAAIAKAVGVAQPTWSRIENGSIPITVEHLASAARELGETPGKILQYADDAAEKFQEQGVQVTPRRADPSGMDDQGLAFIKGVAVVALLAAIFGGRT